MTSIENNFKILCNKENIYLSKDKEKNMYLLEFKVKNPKIFIPNLINFKIYELLFELNKDVIESVEIKRIINENEIDVLILFKQFGESFGIKKKFMYVNVQIEYSQNIIYIRSNDLSLNDTSITNFYEPMKNDLSFIRIASSEDGHEIDLQNIFKMSVSDELPIFMENITGILMKKIFHRLKLFIENLG